MKRNELRVGDIVVCDYSWLGRPTVYYVVLGETTIGNIMVSFDGDVNCGDRPSGWYPINDNNLPSECIRVYRPTWIGNTFNGDFDNEEHYECLYRKDD